MDTSSHGKANPFAKFRTIQVFTLVAMSGGIMPGAMIVAGFKLMNAFDRFIGDDMNLLNNIDDPQYIERFRSFSEWYEYTQPLGGRMYLEVVEELFKQNKLVEGRLEVLGRRVDLTRIYHPLYLVGGNKDGVDRFENAASCIFEAA